MILDVAAHLLEDGLSAAALVVRGVDNTRTSPELLAYRKTIGQRLAGHWKNRSISSDPAIREYHRVHEKHGVQGESPSPEKLILTVRRNRDFASLGAVVDCYNMVSARTLLSIGAHDLDRLELPITLRCTTAADVYVPLGQTEPQRLAGEYSYVDPRGRVICRLEARQCEHSKVTRDSQNIVIFLQGNRCLPGSTLLKGCWLLAEMVTRFCGGQAELVSFFDAGPIAEAIPGKAKIAIEMFKSMNLQVGTVQKMEPLPALPDLSVVTVRTQQDTTGLAPSASVTEAFIGRRTAVIVGLAPLSLAGREVNAYLPSSSGCLVDMRSPIPDGQRLY